jgi:hypothetical protein
LAKALQPLPLEQTSSNMEGAQYGLPNCILQKQTRTASCTLGLKLLLELAK